MTHKVHPGCVNKRNYAAILWRWTEVPQQRKTKGKARGKGVASLIPSTWGRCSFFLQSPLCINHRIWFWNITFECPCDRPLIPLCGFDSSWTRCLVFWTKMWPRIRNYSIKTSTVQKKRHKSALLTSVKFKCRGQTANLMVHLSDVWYIHVLMSHYLLDEWLSCARRWNTRSVWEQTCRACRFGHGTFSLTL